MSAFANVDSNPFEDPAVRNLTHQQTNSAQSTLEGYNPFENGQKSNSPNMQVASSVPPDVTLQTQPVQQVYSDPPPPSYTTTAAQDAAALELQRKQEELERKARELQAREENLANSIASGQIHQKNWPPLPKKCCVGPCFYQDISIEIPDAFQKTVRAMYYMWLFYTLLLFLNMLGALALFIANGDGTTFGVSLLISILFTPLSFVCWFRPLYQAFRSDSSFNFMVFFFIFFSQLVIALLYAVGIPHMGSCGLLNGITTLTSSGPHSVSVYSVGIIAVFIGFLWAIFALSSFFMLVKIHRIYRTTGASLAKAQEEFASGVMRNPHVQSAATSVVTNVAQEAINRQASGTRY